MTLDLICCTCIEEDREEPRYGETIIEGNVLCIEHAKLFIQLKAKNQKLLNEQLERMLKEDFSD